MQAVDRSRAVIAGATSVAFAAVLLPLDVAGPVTLLWAFAVSVVLTVRVLKIDPARRRPWGLLAIAGWLIASGVLVRGVHGLLINVDQPLPSPADLIHMPAYLIFLYVSVAIHRSRSTRRDFYAWLDAIIVVLGFAILLWVAALATYATDGAIPIGTRALSLTYNTITLVSVAVFFRISATPGHRPPAYYLLGAAGLTFFIADIAVVFASTSDGVAASVVLSPMTYGLVLAAAFHSSATEVMDRHEEAESRISPTRHIMIAFSILSPVIATTFWANNLTTFARAVLVALACSLSFGVILRISALLRDNQEVADLERTLTSQIARLASLDSSDRVEDQLPRAAMTVLGAGSRVSFGPLDSRAVRHIPVSLGASESTLEGLNVFDEVPGPSHQRLLETLARDAGFIAKSADAKAAQARQASEAEANRRIAANERRFRALVQNASDVVAVLDRAGNVSYISESCERVLGYPTEEFVGRDLQWITHENDWNFALEYFEATVNGTESHREHELRATHSDGSTRLLIVVITDMRQVDGVEGIVVNVSDVTETRALERNLRDAETTDPLTLLLNRTAFVREADAAIRRSSVAETSVAMAIVNIDDFRLINEGYGTATADQLLIELAHRVKQSVRIDDIVARLNGDEFGILMPSGYTSLEAEAVVARVLDDLAEPISIGGRKIALRATAGVTIHADADQSGIGMLRDADTALDAAKQANRGSLIHFDQAMGEEVSERVELRNLLRDAIQNEDLRLAYQPVVDMETGRIVSLEALARWHDPVRGDIGPATFIPIAEAAGIISPLGDWALRSACRAAVEWSELGFDDFSVSVNMSGHQLRQENIIGKVRDILHGTGVDPERVTIEITESVLIDDTDFIAERISALRDLGPKLAIDDFGTGYSSLSYLRRYEFDVLKIDRSFVIPLADNTNKREREIVNAMIKLAQALGAKTIAEGIEESEEYAVLRTLGCDHAQGFLFWRPLEHEDVIDALRTNSSDIAA